MAYAALLSLTRTIENILFSSLESQVVDQELQIKSLHGKLALFISFLENTSQNNSDSIEDLEERIRDGVYEAEDIIESHMSKQILSIFGSQSSEENYEEDIQNVMEKIVSIWEEVEKMKNESKIEASQIMDPHQIGPTTLVEVESTSEIEKVVKMQPIVGFEDNMLRIKELLSGSSTELETISIVGMGGIGKTTLLRNIYNDPFVKRRFDIRAWTTVSQKYNVVALLADLLKSMGNPTNRTDKEELKLKLYQSLKQRRYLIAIDDVWDTDFLKEFKKIFPDDDNGSRIIMTSRSFEVANFEQYSNHIHRMNFLSPKHSWNLLCQKAFGEEPCPPRLQEIGWKIAKKCRGLPLALTVVGGVLHEGEKTLVHWKYVEENMKSAEAGNYDDLMEILSWSYNNLPYHLKACFLYMAVYPEDYVINVSHLMRLWLAEGFIKPIPHKNLEQVAKEYLKDLIARNLVMVHDQTCYDEIKSCTIHDLMRDLCARKAQKKMFLHVVDKDDEEAIKNQRFLSIHREEQFYFGHGYDPTVRSLLYFRRCGYELPVNIPLQLLRVLDACNINFNKFPTQIIKLVNLRYLAIFYDGKGAEIPRLISKLCNLQTFIVIRNNWRSNARILYLPLEILEMPWLRHLLVDGSSFLSYPCGARDGNLQVLSGMVDFRFTDEAIVKFSDLKTLGIVYHYNRETKLSFYCLENVVHMHQLEHLKLHFIRQLSGDVWCQLPLNLCFPQKLNKLTLQGCKISRKQMSMIGSLPSLEVLKLKNVHFEDCVWKTNEGEFSELKFLLVRGSCLVHWEVEETHFPSLECLTLLFCWRLRYIPSRIGEIPNLRDIFLYECSSSVVDSANKILEEQHGLSKESLQLHNGFTSGICFHKRYFASWEV